MAGQAVATAARWFSASVAPAAGGQEVDAGRVVHPVDGQAAAAQHRREGVGESLTDPADAGRLAGAPGEHQLDIGAAVGVGRRGRRRSTERGDRRSIRAAAASGEPASTQPKNAAASS